MPFPFDTWVLLEDVQPLDGASFPITFRAEINVCADHRLWSPGFIEIPDGNIDGWRRITHHGGAIEQAIHSLCWEYLASDAGYEAVERAIVAAEEHERQFGFGRAA